MKKGIFYLNNTGSRWITYPKEPHTFTTTTGQQVTRKAVFYESFGNFGVICINWKGKKIKVFPDSILPESQEEVNQINFNQFNAKQ